MTDLQDLLLLEATGWRHGIVPPVQMVEPTLVEPDGFFNAAVPQRTSRAWQSAAGGASWTRRGAEIAAVGEALERYAAATPLVEQTTDRLPGTDVITLGEFGLFSREQMNRGDFPFRAAYSAPAAYVRATSLADGQEAWVPSALVRMHRDAAVSLASSNGLALAVCRDQALVRAMQELVERDALTVAWLHSLPGRELPLPEAWEQRLPALSADIHLLDLSPAGCPWAVMVVMGSVPVRGRLRCSLGAACRDSWEEAAEKALLEWCQGIVFAGYYLAEHPGLTYGGPSDVRSFDDHAAYYSARPEQWGHIPMLRSLRIESRPATGRLRDDWSRQLEEAGRWMAGAGIRLYHVLFRPPDLRQLGLYVVKALSPDLVPIFCDQRWPHLGGSAVQVARRFPDLAHLSSLRNSGVPAKSKDFVGWNPLPHPLG